MDEKCSLSLFFFVLVTCRQTVQTVKITIFTTHDLYVKHTHANTRALIFFNKINHVERE